MFLDTICTEIRKDSSERKWHSSDNRRLSQVRSNRTCGRLANQIITVNCDCRNVRFSRRIGIGGVMRPLL